MRFALLVSLFASLPIRAADTCSVFPDPKYGTTVTVSVELYSIDGSWWGESLCNKRHVRIFSGDGLQNDAWLARLKLELPSNLSRTLSRLTRESRRAEKRGGFLYVTATVTGTIRPLEPRKNQAELAVVAIQSLKLAEQPSAANLPVISMCELFKNLPSFNRKRVAIRGELSGNPEGDWLAPTEKCTERFVTNMYPWGYDLWFDGSDIELPASSRSKETISGVFVGVVVLADDYFVRCRFGRLEGVGFGHLGESPGVFWTETVLNPVAGPPIYANNDERVIPTCAVNAPPSSKQ